MIVTWNYNIVKEKLFKNYAVVCVLVLVKYFNQINMIDTNIECEVKCGIS